MIFTVTPFDVKYQHEVISLLERIQEGEYSLRIEEGQREELQSISETFQKDRGNY